MPEIRICDSRDSIDSFIKNALAETIGRLSLSKNSLIFIKPNFNSDMIALTGNTTDLRVIISVVENFKSLGYSNIIIGDGTSSGFINAGIDVLGRLGIKRLCDRLKVGYLDLNTSGYKEVPFLNTSLKIAAVCFEADLFINLPKLKTHAEAMLSACLKNMIGCVTGRDKQKVHTHLASGILELNRIVKPHLHIVDALVSMEDTGPSRGKPKLTGYLVFGSDALAIDYFLSEWTGIGDQRVPYLKLAEEKGLLQDGDLSVQGACQFKFQPPRPGILFRLINSGALRGFFARLRYLPVLNRIISSSFLSAPLYALGARQDFFNKQDDSITGISVDEKLCGHCRLCVKYCPLGINIPVDLKPFPGCIKCFYCYFVCPRDAVKLEGRAGYLKYQISRYKHLIRKEVR